MKIYLLYREYKDITEMVTTRQQTIIELLKDKPLIKGDLLEVWEKEKPKASFQNNRQFFGVLKLQQESEDEPRGEGFW